MLRIFGRTPYEQSEPSPVSKSEADDSAAQSATATSAKKIQDTYCMNGVSGRKLSSAPPVLWLQRMGGIY